MRMEVAAFLGVLFLAMTTSLGLRIVSCGSKERDAVLETRVERLEAIVSIDVELEGLRARVAELEATGP